MTNQTTPVYFGSVNRWECDENDHLNVRFFAHKMQQTLQYGLVEQGITDQASATKICRNTRVQHMRYLAEARIAVPMAGYFQVIKVDPTSITVLTELKNTATDITLATFVNTIEGVFTHLNLEETPLPDYAAARGVSDEAFFLQSSSRQALIEKGCTVIGKGVIQPEECDEDGYLQQFMYIGRNSDSMPNLFARFEDEQRGNGMIGGAVLEYRMSHYSALKCGDRYELLSGVKALGDKTQTFAHVLFNVATNEMVTGAEALAITMDLVARKSVSIPAGRKKKMQALLIQ